MSFSDAQKIEFEKLRDFIKDARNQKIITGINVTVEGDVNNPDDAWGQFAKHIVNVYKADGYNVTTEKHRLGTRITIEFETQQS